MNITFIPGHLCKERQSLLDELAIDFGKNGAKVTIISGFPSRGISEEVRQYYLNHPFEELAPNVTVKRIGSKRGEGEGLLDRMLRYLKLSWTLYKEAKKTPTDVYYLYSSPPFMGWIGILLAKKAPTVYNAQDLFPETLIKIKGYGNGNPLIKFLRYMEKKVYLKNTRIVTISEEMKQTIVECSHCSPDKVDVVYNWSDTDVVHHVDRKDNKLMDELGIPKDRFIVSYAGDIGLFQGWPVIFESIKILNEKCSEILFAIIGDGSYKAELIKKIDEANLSNVMMFPLQSGTRLSEIYSIGDLEMVSIEPGISKMALPSKTWTILAAGSPVLSLVDQSCDIAKLIKKLNMGYTLEHGNSEALADVIMTAYKERETLPEKGKNARKFSVENTSRATQTQKYYDVIESMVKK